ncbi:hypothetical protein HOF92_15055 [bacterium]|nr:hypothetical protein [bacterium]
MKWRNQGNSSKSGLSLVEIVVAAAILVTFLLPVFGLYLMNTRSTEYTSSWSVGINIAQNVMERLISEDVPFLSMDSTGFSGGTKSLSGRSQMDFRGGFGTMNFSNYRLPTILGASGGGAYRLDSEGDRIIVKHGISFKVMVWVGIYADDLNSPDPGSPGLSYKHNAEPESEMTFSYYPNPWFDYNNDCAEDNASGESLSADLTDVNSPSTCAGTKGRPLNPYGQKAGWEADPSKPHYNVVDDPMDDRYRHGFPIPGGANWSESSAGNTWQKEQDGTDSISNVALHNGPYFVRYEDKAFHNTEDLDGADGDDGGFMKIIVGLKWTPRGPGGAGASRRDQEYYLVSFKANLQAQVN